VHQEGILLSPPTGRLVLSRAFTALHAPCRALITPEAVALECAGKQLKLARPPGTPSDPLADGLTQAVGDLLTLLDQAKVQGRRVQVVVSDAWARPLVETLPDRPATDLAIDTLLATHYRKIYGDLMTGWRCCWSQHNARLVGVAWPAAALDALQTGLAQRDCVLASAKPLGVVLGARLAAEPGACWLAVVARAHVSLMRLQNGELQDWRVVSGMGDVASLARQWPLQLARQASSRGDACRALVIIDFDAAHDLPATRKNLLEAGWSARVCAGTELAASWAWRLQQHLQRPHVA